MKYYLIGERLIHSLSQVIHGKMGFDYSLKEIARDKIAEFMTSGTECGFNVTIPYKKDVLPYLTSVSETAGKAGCVNTVLKTEKTIAGFNTDAYGLKYLFNRKGVSLEGKNVLIAGNGATAGTASYVCESAGAKRVERVSRKGRINFDNCYELFPDAEIIINATPVGMFPNDGGTPVILKKFKNLSFVADCVYNPLRTRLIQTAEQLGINCSDGLPMLVAQALLSEKIWKGDLKDDFDGALEEIEPLIKDIAGARENVVLIGMPSCGKSTTGKIIAEKLGREFIDTDRLVAVKTGKTAGEYINAYGLDAFRKVESEVIASIDSVGAVIATGGGSVLDPENVFALKKNGRVFYIERELSHLSVRNRPVSQSRDLSELYRERKPVYEKTADYTVKFNENSRNCAERIIKLYENTRY